MIRRFVTLLTVAAVFTLCARLDALPADNIETLDNRDYFPKLHALLSGARSSVRVIMFSAAVYPDKPRSPTNLIVQDLIDAKRRGVDVAVILECGDKERDRSINEKNGAVKSILEKEKIIVYNEPVKITTHSKLIVIDGQITVIGSTNWSFAAVARNNETAVAIFSRDLASHYTAYFESVARQR